MHQNNFTMIYLQFTIIYYFNCDLTFKNVQINRWLFLPMCVDPTSYLCTAAAESSEVVFSVSIIDDTYILLLPHIITVRRIRLGWDESWSSAVIVVWRAVGDEVPKPPLHKRTLNFSRDRTHTVLLYYTHIILIRTIIIFL